jgi:amino acid adenylation domain-containing protein/non-ribosomal peptide synthase protein (TIGR01720 family)
MDSIEMSEAVDGFRLSPLQVRLWSLSRSGSADRFYCRCLVRIEGELDGTLLRAAIQATLERHEILRTCFRPVPGLSAPLQVIAQGQRHVTAEIDWSGLAPSEQSRGIEMLWRRDRAIAFDLVKGPVLRTTLIRLSEQQHLLLVVLPAFCTDLRGLGLLVSEIAESYSAARDDRAARGDVLQYADLAEWQNQLLEAEDTRAGREHWLQQAIPLRSEASLPFPKRGIQPVFEPRSISWEMPRASTMKVARLAREASDCARLFLFSCWQLLLWRLTGGNDPLIGWSSDARERSELGGALGLLDRYAPAYRPFDPDLTIRELMIENGKLLSAVDKWQEYFSWTLLGLPEGDGAFFPNCFSWDRQPPQTQGASDLVWSIVRKAGNVDRFEVELCGMESADSIGIDLRYDAARFDAADMTRLAEDLKCLTESALENPDRAVGTLDFLSPGERHLLLVEMNGTRAEFPAETTLVDLIEGAAERAPERIALVFEDERLSYAALEARASRLSRRLRTLGVGPEVRVAVALSRSPDFIVSVLAIAKAGGAYVPLDPHQPRQRLRLMLDRARPELLLTTRSIGSDLAADSVRHLHLDDEADVKVVSTFSTKAWFPPATAANLVYVMFTSGSTGQPKGVAIEHRQLVNYVRAIADLLDLNDDSSFAWVSTVAADLGNTAVFLSLCRGGSLHIVSESRAFDPSALAQYLAVHRIDCLKIVPSHMGALRLLGDPGEFMPLKRLILGGEACHWDDVDALQRARPTSVVFNHYGPTEATVGALAHRLAKVPPAPASVPLGRPLANLEAFVLDRSFDPLPMEVPGELLLAGRGLSRGYWQDPEATAEVFVPHPFGADPGARLYRTGDRCRCRADGSIEFLGRIDEQIKIRGYRIELGEVDAALLAHTAVAQAAVVYREETPGNACLAAFVVPRRGRPSPGAPELRRFLQDRLPEYMVPSTFITLPALPLTANGKVDRRALPTVDLGRRASAELYVAPRTEDEIALAEIWSDVLGIGHVGIHDSFFELGGHSLRAMQLVSRVRRVFQVELPLRELFETPTISGLARAIRLRGRPASPVPPLVPVDRKGELPLSFAQQRLWFLDQLVPGAPYNLPAAIRLSGHLSETALRQAFREVVGRQESLRTSFPTHQGRAVQVVSPDRSLVIPLVDVSALLEGDRERELRRLATAEAQRAFDLARGPVLRVSLIRLARRDHAVLFTTHHIVADGWSLGVLVQELATHYAALFAGIPSGLPPLPIQYADFALWQRNWLRGNVLEEQVSHWRSRLAGLRPTELATDRPRPVVQTFHGATQVFALSEELRASAEERARAEGATLFMTLFTVFNILLARYSGQQDVSVGIPIAGRTLPETEGLIGFFVNSLILRTDLSGDPTFRTLLARVREETLLAYAHQDLPFEKLVDEIGPERDLSRQPLFQIMFVFQNAPLPQITIPSGVTLRPVEVDHRTSKFDLTLQLRPEPTGIRGLLEYNTDLFDPTTIHRLREHFEQLLAATLRDPDLPVAEAPILTGAERQQLLVEWNDTETDEVHAPSIHELIDAGARQRPDGVAAVRGNSHLSYGELSSRANRVANYLRSRAIGLESRVGVVGDRSLEMVVGLLGILKAGAAFLPLDPSYPAARLAFMLEDGGVKLVLGVIEGSGERPEQVCIRSQWNEMRDQHDQSAVSVAGETLAYVIYTSGSTGLPKGTLLSHRGLCNLARAQQRAFGVGPAGRVLQFASLGYDAAVWETVMALASGATLILAGHEDLIPGPDLMHLLAEQAVTNVTLPPSALAMLPEAPLPDLEIVVAAGERCSAEVAEKWAPRRRFFNAYGPTEATVCATLEPRPTSSPGPPLIGSAIQNIRVHVLDRDDHPLPIAVPGELLIEGVGLARGYLKRPELTALRFVPSASSARPGTRLYRTGDRVRWRPRGGLEYLGRWDYQVKLRGFRVELAEIEAVLEGHPSVRQAVVVMRQDLPNSTRLVAYVTGREGETGVSVARLRDFVREKLPTHMVPAALVVMAHLPLTASGKIDRASLPAPERARPGLDQAYVAPRSPVEEQIAKIWSKVLGLDRVGVYDNFFELGGDSILSIQVVAKAHEASLRITPRQVFEYQTIAELASVAAVGSPLRMDFDPVQGLVPLTPIQRWFFQKDLAEPHHFNQSMMFELKGAVRFSHLRKALHHLQIHHDALRLRFTKGERGWVQQHAPVEALSSEGVLASIDLSGLDSERAPAQLGELAADVQASLNLSRGPLLRVALVKGLGASDRLLIVIHHLVVDGVSWPILLQDLLLAYEQLGRGEPMQLLPKTTSFKDWSERLMEYAGTESVREEAGFWTEVASTRIAPLPLDHDLGEDEAASEQTVSVSLSLEETKALLVEAPKAYRTQIADLLLAALAEASSGWNGERRLVVDLEGHGREGLFEDVDLSRTVGWFTTMYPVALDIRGAQGPGETLKAVKEQLRRIPRNGIGYGILRYLQAEPGIDGRFETNPPIRFNYLGQLGGELPRDSPYSPSFEARGPAHSRRARRSHLLAVAASVAAGRMYIHFNYSSNRHRRSTIERWADDYLRCLRELICECQSRESPESTVSDFPLAQLDEQKLNQVARLLQEIDEDSA